MKQTPQMQNLELLLRTSRIVAGGFLGNDTRPLQKIIDSDLAHLDQLDYTSTQLAGRMQELTEKAIPRLGNWIDIEENLTVASQDYKGWIICPWPHPTKIVKRVTIAKRLDTEESIRWTDLNIHMIAHHNFFEGHGSIFRIDPAKLISIIF